MTTTNAELRALAEKATRGPWHIRNSFRGTALELTDIQTPDSYARFFLHDDAAYIAAVHPARIIELLSQLDSRDEQITDQVQHIGKWESRAHKAEDHAVALRTKLDLAMRALEGILGETERGIVHNLARHALAQLKEQP